MVPCGFACLLLAAPACNRSDRSAAPAVPDAATMPLTAGPPKADASSAASAGMDLPERPPVGGRKLPEVEAGTSGDDARAREVVTPGLPPSPAVYPPGSLVREEKQVVVDGVTETWKLVWRKPPTLGQCSVEPFWVSCLCGGFAFSESGELDLVRFRPGAPEDRLPLTPLFADVGPDLEMRHWVPLETDYRLDDHNIVPPREIAKRAVADVMQLGDYDHDGRDTEFVVVLSTGNPCGNSYAVVVGISRSDPKLHVFGTVDDPHSRLTLGIRAWEEVRHGTGTVRIVEFGCGNHGSEEEQSHFIVIDGAGLHDRGTKTRRCASCSTSCPDGHACFAWQECQSGFCLGGVCRPPACAPKCKAEGGDCAANDDCASLVCKGGRCASCSPSCTRGAACQESPDCASWQCKDGTCRSPLP
jgi:hypothetical protein